MATRLEAELRDTPVDDEGEEYEDIAFSHFVRSSRGLDAISGEDGGAWVAGWPGASAVDPLGIHLGWEPCGRSCPTCPCDGGTYLGHRGGFRTFSKELLRSRWGRACPALGTLLDAFDANSQVSS